VLVIGIRKNTAENTSEFIFLSTKRKNYQEGIVPLFGAEIADKTYPMYSIFSSSVKRYRVIDGVWVVREEFPRRRHR
jgi:hypothetical protein